jgi:hypothetical protein
MRTTVTLPDDVHAAVKTLSDASGRSVSEVVADLIRRGLTPTVDLTAGDGLPVFVVAPGAEIIPGSRAAELLADESVE